MNVYSKQISPEEYCKYVEDPNFIDHSILYKYRDWKNPFHKSILLDNKIYFASPSSFEDEFDCNIPESFPAQNELPAIFWRMSFKEIPYASLKERIAFVKKWCRDFPLANPIERERISREMKITCNTNLGVLSLTARPDNIKMWEKYGANNQGICFGFNKEKLRTIAGGGGPIIYTDNLPSIIYFKDDAITQYIKRIYYKSRTKWSFEEEYRLHKNWFIEGPPSEAERNMLMPDGTIVSIYLGSAMSIQDKHEIRTIVAEKATNIKIIEL